MKHLSVFFVAVLMMLGSCNTKTGDNKQSDYNGLPVIKAKSAMADYRIGSDWVRGNWRISPQIEADSLFLNCFSANERFAFYTDIDSISFDLALGQAHSFYVVLNDTAQALTVVKGVSPDLSALKFDTSSKNESLKFWYEPNNNNKYLDELRDKFPIDSLVKDAKTDTEKAQNILNWVHTRWQHDGNNQPRKNDAISILEEVKEGKNFRCVEYGIVASACLNSVGLKARTLALKTKDVETRQYGAGHVLTEVYLNDLGKWALLDGQWDAMPVLNGVPLNAVEFQKAISENYPELEIRTNSGLPKRMYTDWIYPYLYFFDVSFDNREGTGLEKNKVDGKVQLMLVPTGEKNPTVFQRNYPIDYCIYTHSLNDFYAPPASADL